VIRHNTHVAEWSPDQPTHNSTIPVPSTRPARSLLPSGSSRSLRLDKAIHHGIKPLSGDLRVNLVAQFMTHHNEAVHASIFV
jgi:hypothetical protein